jgi:hypothetical protein
MDALSSGDKLHQDIPIAIRILMGGPAVGDPVLIPFLSACGITKRRTLTVGAFYAAFWRSPVMQVLHQPIRWGDL